MSKRFTRKPSNPVPWEWEGAGLGLDAGNPTDLLTAIDELRSVGHASLARQRPGRPPWTEELFLEHWHEAVSEAAPSARLADIAACFRKLNGARGVDPDHLRRLRETFTEPTFIPE